MTPQADVALAPLTTMGVGGAARWFVAARDESDVADALNWADRHGITVHVLGGGSNVVIADEGIDGLVIHVVICGVERRAEDEQMTFCVGAGEQWDEFVATAVTADCAGLECLSGIPGLVGGTPVQNVGAYGQDVSTSITRVRVVDRQQGSTYWLDNRACDFGYRTSRFKHADADRFVVSRVEFKLALDAAPTMAYADVAAYFEATGEEPSLQRLRQAVLTIRRRKGMVIEPENPARHSCGSFFINPVVDRADLQRVQSVVGHDRVPHYAIDRNTVKVPAAFLIEQAGFPKGTSRGAVGLSPYQAQAIMNRGGARAMDIVGLALEIKRSVWKVFGISIVPEPVFVGFSPSSELRVLLTHQGGH